MSSDQLTSFNLHLAKQCRPISKLPGDDAFKKLHLKYSKSNGSTSSYFNSELDDDFELDEENSNDTSVTSENALPYDSKFSDLLPKSGCKGVLNESNLGRLKLDIRQRVNQCISKRRAANLRERKRMKSINYAFDVSSFFRFEFNDEISIIKLQLQNELDSNRASGQSKPISGLANRSFKRV